MSGGNRLGQWRGEFVAALAVHLPGVDGLVLRRAVKEATLNWKVEKRSDVYVAPEGQLTDGGHPLDGDPSGVDSYRVLWTLNPPARPLNRNERITKEQALAASEWRWSGKEFRKTNPPPRGVPAHVLLGQRKWWLPAGCDAVKVKTMDPGHRGRLLVWMENNADSLHVSSLGVFRDAPEEVQNEAFAEDSFAWLGKQPLYKRIKELVERHAAREA